MTSVMIIIYMTCIEIKIRSHVFFTTLCWSVCTNPGKWAVMCLKDIEFVSTIFLLDFGPVPTLFAVCFIFHFKEHVTPNLDLYACHISNIRDRCHMYNIFVLLKRNDNLWHSERILDLFRHCLQCALYFILFPQY
jgi:hypothetical protein